jgi:hypothetical protein
MLPKAALLDVDKFMPIYNQYHYTCNGKQFNHYYLAQHEAFRTGGTVHMYCNDAEYDKLNWRANPTESFETLMDRRAIQLRNKYDRLILFWSGGTDSHTIYNVFKRNKLHIDEIVIMGNEQLETWFPMSTVDWIHNNHWDPTTTITFLDKNDTKLKKLEVKNENWLWEDRGSLLIMGQAASDAIGEFLCDKNHASKNWAMITGHEKPHVVYSNGVYWSSVMDRAFRQSMGTKNYENFFLDPILHLKQSHLLKNGMKQIAQKLAKPFNNGTTAHVAFNADSVWGYRAYARSCGRHDEVKAGVSCEQKHFYRKNVSLKVTGNDYLNIDPSQAEPLLVDGIKADNDTAQVYLRGILNVVAEKDFMEWLGAFHLLHPNAPLDTKPIYSKAYCLGV